MKHYITPIVFCLLCSLPTLSNADNIVSETEHTCKINGCNIRCANKHSEWNTVGKAKKVKITIFSSGVTRIILDNGFDGVQTLVMGGSGYICSIENQEH